MTPHVSIPIDVAREALRSLDRMVSNLYAEVGNETNDDLRDGVPVFTRRVAIADLKRALKNIDAIRAAIRLVDPGQGDVDDVIGTWARAVVAQYGHEVAA